jgi:L-seryl-tRNA(Ser) seleniumtransferase
MSALLQDILKRIPKVDKTLEWPEISALREDHSRPEILASVRSILDNLRNLIRTRSIDSLPDRQEMISAITSELTRRCSSNLQTVINGTGVVIHTNLGRSPLACSAETAIHTASRGYSNLEYNLSTGERGSRNTHVEELICELTGAESALVVNNNAAAVMLALSELAAGREVIISRGELVEIGGSFRIPDVMRQSGAKLMEVGTTNRTHLRDFKRAVSPETGLLLKVHPSNFSITGFTAEVSIAEMAELGRECGLPVMLDAGSGCLIDLTPYGISGEPTIRRSINEGAGVVTFSGDKLLGGPQAGIIAGSRELIEPMKRNPLLRAFRLDKLSLAALEATLRLYRDERSALREIPVLRMLTMTAQELSQRATLIIRRLRRKLPDALTLSKREGESSAGGGSFPLLQLPTTLIEIRLRGFSPIDIESALRRAATPVIGRINQDCFLLDARTLLDSDIPALADSLCQAALTLSRNELC